MSPVSAALNRATKVKASYGRRGDAAVNLVVNVRVVSSGEFNGECNGERMQRQRRMQLRMPF